MLGVLSFILGIPVLLWLCIFLITLYRNKTGANFKTRFSEMATWKKVAVPAIFLFVISSYVLATQGFYYSFIKPTGYVVLVGLIVIAVWIFINGMKLGTGLVVSTIVLSLPAMGTALLSLVLMEYSYETLVSPNQRTGIVIEHRSATLGETNHYYTFYKKVPYLPIMENLNQDAHVMTRDFRLDDLQVLGADRAEWFDGYIVFEAITGETFTVEWEKQQALLLGKHSDHFWRF
jgi:hypothetical protein